MTTTEGMQVPDPQGRQASKSADLVIITSYCFTWVPSPSLSVLNSRFPCGQLAVLCSVDAGKSVGRYHRARIFRHGLEDDGFAHFNS